jgi:hypothetical protein
MKFEDREPDYSKWVEVFTRDHCETACPPAYANGVKIELKKQIGQGGQAAVYDCVLRTETGLQNCVTKLQKVFNNAALCAEKYREMYKEFRIGVALKHPNVISYVSFVRMDS